MTDQQPAEPNKTIFVKNVPYSADGKELANHFSKFGDILQSRIITFVSRGQSISRGFGFIDFKTVEGFQKAIDNKETITMKNNANREFRLFIAAALPRVHRPQDTIFLGGLDKNVTEQDIRSVFSQYAIVEVRFPNSRNPAQAEKKFAFVKFESEDVYNQVIALRTVKINGADVRISRARPPSSYFMRRLGRGRFARGRGRRGRGRGRRGAARGRRGPRTPANANAQQQAPQQAAPQ